MKICRIIFLLISFLSFASQALATVSISIKNEEVPKAKILFFGFDSNDPRLQSDTYAILERIKRNLKTTDLFEILKQNSPLETKLLRGGIRASLNDNLTSDNLAVESVPNFEKYSKAGIGAIVVAQFKYDVNGNLELRIRMWDVLDQRQLFGKLYTASPDNHRRMANIISDEIFKAISGETIGHFSSHIIYVSEAGALKKRIKRINLVDFDGENNRILTDGRELVLTPVFSKKSNEVFYLRYFEGKSQVFALDLRNLRSKRVGGFRGTTLTPAINPLDSNLILLSAITDGNSDIYELNINDNSAKRLTKSPAIDTTPSYSPNGKFITFASDRDAGQQIYVMDANGLAVVRITSGKGNYSKPVWSPDGKLIAFTKIQGGKFYIGVIAPNGKGEKLLTSSYLSEGARWSPNSRYLVYSKKRGPYGAESMPRLYVIDVITGFEFELPTPQGEGATDPDWA